MAFGKDLRKKVEKFKSSTVHLGFETEADWVSVGNYAMNKLISGSYKKAFPYGRSVLIGGESGSGKSLVLATAAAQAQKKDNAHVVWLDAENATTDQWLKDLDVDISEDNFTYLNVATVEDVKSLVADVVALSDKQNDGQKIFIVVDSWSNLMTEKQQKEAESGVVKGDQGQQAKQLKDVIKGTTHMITRRPIIVAGVVHTYESQDQFNPGEKFSGGRGLVYLASIAFVFQKLKLKAKEAKLENEEYSDIDDKKQIGTKCKVNLYKSRFSKPNEVVEAELVYPYGLDPYSGLFTYLENEGVIISPSQGYYEIVWPEGLNAPEELTKRFRKKEFRKIADQVIDILEEGSTVNIVSQFDQEEENE